jgi:hypothetical protein
MFHSFLLLCSWLRCWTFSDIGKLCSHEPWLHRWGVSGRGMIRLWEWILSVDIMHSRELLTYKCSTSLMCEHPSIWAAEPASHTHLYSHLQVQGTNTFHRTAAQELLEYQGSTRQIKCNIISISVQQPLNLCSMFLDLHSFSLVNIPFFCSRSRNFNNLL